MPVKIKVRNALFGRVDVVLFFFRCRPGHVPVASSLTILGTNVTRGSLHALVSQVFFKPPSTLTFRGSGSSHIHRRQPQEVHLRPCGPGLPTLSRATTTHLQRKASLHPRATSSTKSMSNIQTSLFSTPMNPVQLIHTPIRPTPPLSTGKGICSSECQGVHSRMSQK